MLQPARTNSNTQTQAQQNTLLTASAFIATPRVLGGVSPSAPRTMHRAPTRLHNRGHT